MDSTVHYWTLPFLQSVPPPLDKSHASKSKSKKTALIILNQPFSKGLLHRLWYTSDWHCCADGGANRLYDLLMMRSDADADASTGGGNGWIARLTSWWFSIRWRRTEMEEKEDYIPDLVKGDLDSLREDVRRYYETRVSAVIDFKIPSSSLFPPSPHLFLG